GITFLQDAHKRFDKASLLYDQYAFFMSQARDKYLSLKKGTRADIATVIEEVNSVTLMY
ncbi:hypothetical protein GW17_00046798, partial [Ensete ventricosum]